MFEFRAVVKTSYKALGSETSIVSIVRNHSATPEKGLFDAATKISARFFGFKKLYGQAQRVAEGLAKQAAGAG
jgi:hypothetical protein